MVSESLRRNQGCHRCLQRFLFRSSSPLMSSKVSFPFNLSRAYKCNYDICTQLYNKELLTEDSYNHIYGLQDAGFNAQQLAVVAGLCEWRDVVARTEDESTGFVLPNKTLLDIAQNMPLFIHSLRRLLKTKHSYVERHLGSVLNIIRHAMHNSGILPLDPRRSIAPTVSVTEDVANASKLVRWNIL